jgi:hypothetical protein
VAAPRIRRVQTRKEMESVRDDFITQGYQILREGEGTTLMRFNTWGSLGWHVVIALLTFWLFFVPNVIYAIVAHSGADQVMLKMEEPEATATAQTGSAAQSPS